MYEVTERLQKIAKECRFSILNEKVVQLKQITNWNNFNNSLLFDKNTWRKVNEDMKHSLEIGILYNFKLDFNNITQNISNVPKYARF